MSKIIFVSIILFLCGVISTQDESLSNKLKNKQFKVTKFSSEKLTKLKEKLNAGNPILKFNDDYLDLYGICNSCNFKIIYYSGSSINISSSKCTKMYCGEVMLLENFMIDLLENAKMILDDGGKLVIHASNEKEITAESN